MKTVAFLRPMTLGRGAQAARVDHDWLNLPDAAADELLAAHPGNAICIALGPVMGAVSAAFGLSHPRRLSSLHIIDCNACAGGGPRMTACRTCGGAQRLMRVA